MCNYIYIYTIIYIYNISYVLTWKICYWIALSSFSNRICIEKTFEKTSMKQCVNKYTHWHIYRATRLIAKKLWIDSRWFIVHNKWGPKPRWRNGTRMTHWLFTLIQTSLKHMAHETMRLYTTNTRQHYTIVARWSNACWCHNIVATT